jgi:nucleotide-binding universal stress UspA family protein
MEKPIRSIVVGLAELPDEDPQFVPAVALAAALGASLHVVHAFHLPDPIVYPSAGVTVFNPELIEEIRDEMRSLMETQVGKVSGDVQIDSRAAPTPADRAILEVAEEVGADLIVVGATRRGTLARTILGTTAQRVVRAARVPVLVNRRPLHGPVHRVLLATDLSEASEEVYRRGREVAEELGTEEVETRALVVISYDFAPPPPLSPDALRDAAQAELDRFLARAEPGAPATRGKVRTGDAAKEIVAEAADWDADLLVVGTQGRTGPSRLLIGSVAEAVVRNALCNVLAIPSTAAPSAGEDGAGAGGGGR